MLERKSRRISLRYWLAAYCQLVHSVVVIGSTYGIRVRNVSGEYDGRKDHVIGEIDADELWSPIRRRHLHPVQGQCPPGVKNPQSILSVDHHRLDPNQIVLVVCPSCRTATL